MRRQLNRPPAPSCVCGGGADAAPDTAMTEIALALAMAFFSLMVLTMMSMAVPPTSPAAASDLALADRADTLTLAATTRQPQAHRPQASGLEGNTATDSARQVIIHYAGRLWTSDLTLLEPNGDNAAPLITGPAVLAVAPDLPLGEAVALRQRLAIPDLVVSTLDEPWLARLREEFP